MTNAPTLLVSLHVFVPTAIRHGWAWAAWAYADPAAIERLTDLAELPLLLRTYAVAASRVLRFKDAERFNVTAFGGRSGAVLGRDQWLWNVDLSAYRAHGEPWVPLLSKDRLVVTQPLPVLQLPLAAPPVLRIVA